MSNPDAKRLGEKNYRVDVLGSTVLSAHLFNLRNPD